MGKSKRTEPIKCEAMKLNVNNNKQTTDRIRTCRICKKEFLMKDLLKVQIL